MDGLHISLIVLFGVVSCIHDSFSGSMLEATVRPGDNITLYCDCKLSSGVYIVWYRNCSHENQPSFVLKVNLHNLNTNKNKNYLLKPFPRFEFVRNFSSDSYDLLITNITDSDEGVYYCGTEERSVEDKEYIAERYIHTYGNITTRIGFIFGKHLVVPDSSPYNVSNPAVSWLMVFTPAFTILSSFISFILVYHFCQKTDKEAHNLQKRPDTRGPTRRHQDEDLCFTRVVFRPKDGQTHQ